MAQDHSLDIVSKVDLQELRNAIQQAQKEVLTRYDFKGTQAGITYEDPAGILKLTADQEMQLKTLIDLLEIRLAKRGVSPRSFLWENPEKLPSGSVKQQAKLQQGLSSEKAREVVKAVKDLGLKVQPRIEGDSVRVYARQIDDLQAMVQAIKSKDFGVALQMENYR